jgi:hypothetical protein
MIEPLKAIPYMPLWDLTLILSGTHVMKVPNEGSEEIATSAKEYPEEIYL